MRLAGPNIRVSALRIAPVVLSAVVLTSGCDVLGVGSSGAASGSGQITVAVVPGIDTAPVRVAVQDGLFQQHGLKVIVKDYQSSAPSSSPHQRQGSDLRPVTTQASSISRPPAAPRCGSSPTGMTRHRIRWRSSPCRLGHHHSAATAGQGGLVATPLAQMIPDTAALPYNGQTLAAQQVLPERRREPQQRELDANAGAAMIGALSSGRVKAILTTEP